jgi:hypothetical protein
VIGGLLINHDLVFGLLYLHDLAELVWLARLTIADNLRWWFEYAEDFALGTRITFENANRPTAKGTTTRAPGLASFARLRLTISL